MTWILGLIGIPAILKQIRDLQDEVHTLRYQVELLKQERMDDLRALEGTISERRRGITRSQADRARLENLRGKL